MGDLNNLSNDLGSNFWIYCVVSLIISVIIFLLLREFWCWYWKVNAAIAELKTMNQKLDRLPQAIGAAINATHASNYVAATAPPPPVQAVQSVQAPPLVVPSVMQQAAPPPVPSQPTCEQCNLTYPLGTKFCNKCGSKLG